MPFNNSEHSLFQVSTFQNILYFRLQYFRTFSISGFNISEHSLFQAYLEVPDGSAEGVLAEPPLLVQKFSGFPVGRGHEQPVVEALLKLLKQVK